MTDTPTLRAAAEALLKHIHDYGLTRPQERGTLLDALRAALAAKPPSEVPVPEDVRECAEWWVKNSPVSDAATMADWILSRAELGAAAKPPTDAEIEDVIAKARRCVQERHFDHADLDEIVALMRRQRKGGSDGV